MASNSGLGFDLGTTGGNWLFKQGELLLGPVPFSKLIELLYAGEVTGETPVSPSGGDAHRFRPLGEIESFRVHLAKAQAKLRVEAQSIQAKRSERRGRLTRLIVTGLATLALLMGGGRLAWWLAIHRPWEKQIRMPEPEITDELPTIKLASARGAEEELTYPGQLNPGTPKPNGKAAPKPGGKTGAVANNKAPAGTSTGKPQVDTDGLATHQSWDQGAIDAVVKTSKSSLHRCIKEEVSRRKGTLEARIPIEFTIGNDGRVTKLWIDNPDFKAESTEMYKCFLGELRKWRFPAYSGEQANVSLAFSVASRSR